jgi:hypothetical protein
MAESVKNPEQPTFSNALTGDEEKLLLAAVNMEQAKRRRSERRSIGR